MRQERCDIAVIGAGPAGLSAATAAARSGAKVMLVDLGAQPGGQYWMKETPHLGAEGARSRAGADLAQAAKAAGVTLFQQAEVWAIFPGFSVCAAQPEGALRIEARALIIAAGAADRVMPFPGWTLPGVMTPGAGQRLVKLGAIAPGRRFLLGGSGPFLLAVAETLHRIGAPAAMLVEAQRPSAAVLTHLLRFPERWGEALRLLRVLAQGRARFGHVVTEALGQDRIEAVRIAPIADDGTIAHDRAELVPDIDALLVGWGFRPSIELTALLGCRHHYDNALGGWHCLADADTGLTSVPGVYVAGEIAGVAGARPARLSGALAGSAAAASLGFATAMGQQKAARQLHRARAFAAGLGRLFQPPPGLAGLMRDDEVVVCRCEEITRGEIRRAYAEGTTRVSGGKLWSRAGMGHCQGRSCGWALAVLAAARGGGVAEAGFNPPRIPVRPVPLAIVLETLAENK